MDDLIEPQPVGRATGQTPERAPFLVRASAFLAVVLPFLGIAAAFFVWGWGFHWVDLGLLPGMYLLTAVGITVGFHRLFVHRSFETNTWVKFVLAALGSMGVVGSLFNWVAQHRRHHKFSDTPNDPHTPHHHGEEIAGVIRGLFNARIGWFFMPDAPGLDRYVKDLAASRPLRVSIALFPVWIVLGLMIPAILGGVISGT
jgi:stearoyl-CoA desaturase (Delta-9 desaturase)